MQHLPAGGAGAATTGSALEAAGQGALHKEAVHAPAWPPKVPAAAPPAGVQSQTPAVPNQPPAANSHESQAPAAAPWVGKAVPSPSPAAAAPRADSAGTAKAAPGPSCAQSPAPAAAATRADSAGTAKAAPEPRCAQSPTSDQSAPKGTVPTSASPAQKQQQQQQRATKGAPGAPGPAGLHPRAPASKRGRQEVGSGVGGSSAHSAPNARAPGQQPGSKAGGQRLEAVGPQDVRAFLSQQGNGAVQHWDDVDPELARQSVHLTG